MGERESLNIQHSTQNFQHPMKWGGDFEWYGPLILLQDSSSVNVGRWMFAERFYGQ